MPRAKLSKKGLGYPYNRTMRNLGKLPALAIYAVAGIGQRVDRPCLALFLRLDSLVSRVAIFRCTCARKRVHTIIINFQFF